MHMSIYICMHIECEHTKKEFKFYRNKFLARKWDVKTVRL